MVIPNDQTSLLLVNLYWKSDSGAYHAIGMGVSLD